MVKFTSAYWRMPSYNYVRYVMTVVTALLYGSLYYRAADIQGSTVPYGNVQV